MPRRAQLGVGRRRRVRRADMQEVPGSKRHAAPYPWHAWPANDNAPPAWRSALGWIVLGIGLGCFAYVAVSLLA